ncbi:MAG: hypothetical protein A4S12_10015 [Proteobacteria bacterium SG_bin5]|nr:MAG: hypothetical protein A4S12_10015 [Proteobacteria bacterium SG_bin5]
MSVWPIKGLCVGSVRPLGPSAVASGIIKQSSDRPILLTKTGFVGDEQGDKRHHGGPDKAVHHYPHDHYAAWTADLGEHPLLRRLGAFGENISTTGLTEANVAIGDRFRLGSAIVEVSQGRQPCFRLNLRFEIGDIAVRMQRTGRTGWYYRVVEEGLVAPGDTLRLLDRQTPGWTIERLRRILYVDMLNQAELQEVAALAHLPERWRRTAELRLRTGVVEDWKPRLDGP